MRIPEQKIEEIRNNADIVDVISNYVQLKKSGSNFKGLCPFHSEKTPSFMVSPDKQIFKCFGCQVGGNVFNFMMEYHKIPFVEAAKELADDYGVHVQYESGMMEGEPSETEALYDINTEAARFYSQQLLEGGKGNPAYDYLEKRYILIRAMRAFGLGYAPSGGTALVNHFKKKKFDLDKAVKLGLFGKGDAGNYYDSFRGRIIYPILSSNGRVVAFAGRILDENQSGPKYWNSPESIIYHKGRILYGLSMAKEEIRKQDFVLVVEGYMDHIALYQNGIENVVAVSGTALTAEQVKLLKRFTNNTYLLFDADTAGIKASIRSIEILLKQNMNVKIISLPEGDDPDSFVNKNGKPAFLQKVEEAENFLAFQTEIYKREGLFDDPEKSAEAIRNLIKPLALLPDELKQVRLLQSIAERFGLRQSLLEAELYKALMELRQYDTRKKPTARSRDTKEFPKTAEADEDLRRIYRNEFEIIKLLFEGSPKIIEYIFQRLGIDEIEHEILRQIAQLAFDEFEMNGTLSISALLDKLEDEEAKHLLLKATAEPDSISKKSAALLHDDPLQVKTKEAIDAIKKNRMMKIEKEKTRLNEKLKSVSDEKKIKEIFAWTKELNEEMKIIQSEIDTH